MATAQIGTNACRLAACWLEDQTELVGADSGAIAAHPSQREVTWRSEADFSERSQELVRIILWMEGDSEKSEPLAAQRRWNAHDRAFTPFHRDLYTDRSNAIFDPNVCLPFNRALPRIMNLVCASDCKARVGSVDRTGSGHTVRWASSYEVTPP